MNSFSKLKLAILTLLISTIAIILPSQAFAQTITEETVEGEVLSIVSFGKEITEQEELRYQILKVQINRGSTKGEIVEVKNEEGSFFSGPKNFEQYSPGDKLRLTMVSSEQGLDYYILGRLKRSGLINLAILFIFVVLIVGRIWGALSILGLAMSFLVIFRIIIPMIIKGVNPVLAAVFGSVIIIPFTFYISHGFNKKTHVGVVSTLISLLITGLLAVYFVDATYLTGFASEEAGFLSVERQGTIDIKGLLLAGVIIGTLGILDDVTIGQASTVQQLNKSNKKLGLSELFFRGMQVGQDHISSMVNTLVLVYSGSALPLLLLFFDSQKTFVDIVEFELIAEEIVRMLVGSIGLILAAPLATFMAAFVFSTSDKK